MSYTQIAIIIAVLWALFAATMAFFWWAQRGIRQEVYQGINNIKDELLEAAHVLADVKDLNITITSTDKPNHEKVKRIKIMADMPSFTPNKNGAKVSKEQSKEVEIQFSTMLTNIYKEEGSKQTS